MRAVNCVSSARSAASSSACTRISGSTAPARMEPRIAASASSGRDRIAGGGVRPMRCSAMSTSASAARRLRSAPRARSSPPCSSASRASTTRISWSNRRSRPAAAIKSAVSFCLSSCSASISWRSRSCRRDETSIDRWIDFSSASRACLRLSALSEAFPSPRRPSTADGAAVSTAAAPGAWPRNSSISGSAKKRVRISMQASLPPVAVLCPMIGMSGKDCHRAVKLLCQKNAHDLVRPCHSAERQSPFC